MAGVAVRGEPWRVRSVEGGIGARDGAPALAGPSHAHDPRPAAPDHARRPPRRGRAAARPHHVHRSDQGRSVPPAWASDPAVGASLLPRSAPPALPAPTTVAPETTRDRQRTASSGHDFAVSLPYKAPIGPAWTS